MLDNLLYPGSNVVIAASCETVCLVFCISQRVSNGRFWPCREFSYDSFCSKQMVLIVPGILLENRWIRRDERVEEPVTENVFAQGDVSIVVST